MMCHCATILPYNDNIYFNKSGNQKFLSVKKYTKTKTSSTQIQR